MVRRIFLVLLTAGLCLYGVSFGQDYLVGEGDVLKVTVYNHEDLTTTARVGGDGTIPFPLVGEVNVGGLTLPQISEKLASLLAEDYVVDPQVSIFVQEFRSKKAFIMGEVQKPGFHVLSGNTTLLELLSVAGGVTQEAGDKATIKRKCQSPDKTETTILVDLKSLLQKGDTSLDVPIMDGDSIYISKSGVFYVTGQVTKTGAYKYEEGLTVIKAVTLAGGFTGIASKGRVRIMRKINGSEEVIEDVKMDDKILPDDVIVVPESFF